MSVLERLEATIAARKTEGDTSKSHTAQLLAKGRLKCAQKFGEEAVEAIIAASTGDKDELISESADTLFHLLVMLSVSDVALKDVLAELERREGISGVAEKASRRG